MVVFRAPRQVKAEGLHSFASQVKAEGLHSFASQVKAEWLHSFASQVKAEWNISLRCGDSWPQVVDRHTLVDAYAGGCVAFGIDGFIAAQPSAAPTAS